MIILSQHFYLAKLILGESNFMEYYKAILSTTHVDQHNEKMTLSALESLVEQSNDNIIPLTVEHDPRKPPIGRIKSTQIKQLEDGEYGLEGTFEIYENDDDFTLPLDDKREMRIKEHNSNSLSIVYDRSYQNPDDQTLIYELNTLIKSDLEPQFFSKKSVEPISVLYIVGAYILGNVTTGFFNQIGSEAWELLKEKIKTIYHKKNIEENEKLLSFEFTIENDGYKINVIIILTDPKDEDIESFLEIGMKAIDSLPIEYFKPELGIKKIVMEYSNNSLKTNFGVRKDAVPVYL